jgi:hypothetical protein
MKLLDKSWIVSISTIECQSFNFVNQMSFLFVFIVRCSKILKNKVNQNGFESFQEYNKVKRLKICGLN